MFEFADVVFFNAGIAHQRPNLGYEFAIHVQKSYTDGVAEPFVQASSDYVHAGIDQIAHVCWRMGQTVCGIHNNCDLGLEVFGFSGDGLHGDELSTQVDHVGEVQHSRLRCDEFGICLNDFKIRVGVFGDLRDFDDDAPSRRGLFEGFNHGTVILVANDYLVVGLPVCAHDDGVEAFGGVSGESDFIG